MTTTDTHRRDTLTSQLERLYYIEQEPCRELQTLSTDVAIDTLDDVRVEACRNQLQEAIDEHCTETERHRERIENAFDALDEEPSAQRVPELDGLIADKEKFNNVILNDELRPLYYVETMLKLEALERTVYEATMAIANTIDGDEGNAVVDALQENYDDERAMRTDLESLADSDSIETLLAATPVDNADRAALDRTW